MINTETFKLNLDEPEMNENYSRINKREAVRAVIFKENKILLVQSNLGDFKFPGGGIDGEESHAQALKREVAEETGYINLEVIKKLGLIIETKPDEYEHNTLFQMNSTYYLCRLINLEKVNQVLDEYEADLDYLPKWVTLDEAIQQNQQLIHNISKNSWLKRETLVLKRMKEKFML
ncbi:MAG: NUDIX hydrolase [Bacillota bacterium]